MSDNDSTINGTANAQSAQQRGELYINLRKGGVDVLRREAECEENFTVEVDASLDDEVRIIEEAVYMTPSLLGEYSHVTVVADTPRFTLIPCDSAANENTLETVRAMMWPETQPGSAITSTACGGATVAAIIEPSLTGFVSRTFGRATVVPRIAALCRFFASLSKPVNNIKIYAHCSSGTRLDIVAMTADTLLMANSFELSDDNDAVYYILAAVKDCGFDQLEDELLLSGNAEMCVAITPVLRKYINSVMPLLLPEKIQKIPFELQINGI